MVVPLARVSSLIVPAPCQPMPLGEASTKASVKLWMPEAAEMAARFASCGIAMSVYGANSRVWLPPPVGGAGGTAGAGCTEIGADSAEGPALSSAATPKAQGAAAAEIAPGVPGP